MRAVLSVFAWRRSGWAGRGRRLRLSVRPAEPDPAEGQGRSGRLLRRPATLASWIANGRLSPLVTQKSPLERAGEAVRTLMDCRALVKVIIQESKI
jgi:hypothetical protein